MDFRGAAPGDGVIYIASDEDDTMECSSFCSLTDTLASSDDEDIESEEIVLMARCAEGQLTEPIPIPGPSRNLDAMRAETPSPFLLPDHTAEQKVFNYGKGNGPIGPDCRVKTNLPINACRELIPQVDTPLLPPREDRWADFAPETPTYEPSSTMSLLESVANHFHDLALSGNTPTAGYSDSIVCGKTAAQ